MAAHLWIISFLIWNFLYANPFSSPEKCKQQVADVQVAEGVVQLQHARLTPVLKEQAVAFFDSLVEQSLVPAPSYCVVDECSQQFFFAGRRRCVDVFKHYLGCIDVPVRQVRIETRIVIADKQFDQSLGMQWSVVYDRSASIKRGFGLARVGGRAGTQAIADAMNWTLQTCAKPWQQASALHIPFLFSGAPGSSRRLRAVLHAAENSRQIKTLLKPTIVTNDRTVAEILEGEVIPIESIIEENIEGRARNTRTASYKDVGIQLRVRPEVSCDGSKVHLDIYVENSMVDPSGSSGSSGLYPTIVTTRSKNSIHLASGQTTMISGLIKNRQRVERRAVPFLSKIPLIGWLFKGRRKVKSDVQLLIFITPTVL